VKQRSAVMPVTKQPASSVLAANTSIKNSRVILRVHPLPIKLRIKPVEMERSRTLGQPVRRFATLFGHLAFL